MEGPGETGNDNRDPNLICPPVSSADSNGNTDNIEDNDNINEAGSEDSGMSSVDNHNLTGRDCYSDLISHINQYCTHSSVNNNVFSSQCKSFKTHSTDVGYMMTQFPVQSQ